jgi:hypothetical protein
MFKPQNTFGTETYCTANHAGRVSLYVSADSYTGQIRMSYTADSISASVRLTRDEALALAAEIVAAVNSLPVKEAA